VTLYATFCPHSGYRGALELGSAAAAVLLVKVEVPHRLAVAKRLVPDPPPRETAGTRRAELNRAPPVRRNPKSRDIKDTRDIKDGKIS
jgi:hypothetical protein